MPHFIQRAGAELGGDTVAQTITLADAVGQTGFERTAAKDVITEHQCGVVSVFLADRH